MTVDFSNGYEAVAAQYVKARSATTGVEVIKSWLSTLPAGGMVLDVGAGDGAPLTEVVCGAGFDVFAIDASQTLVDHFRRRLPSVPIKCEAVETSSFFDRSFDGILAVGLVFLLPEKAQVDFIKKAADALRPGGRLMFSAPIETGTWNDVLTGRVSTSLGEEAYRSLIEMSGLSLVETCVDEGGNNYYSTYKS